MFIVLIFIEYDAAPVTGSRVFWINISTSGIMSGIKDFFRNPTVQCFKV